MNQNTRLGVLAAAIVVAVAGIAVVASLEDSVEAPCNEDVVKTCESVTASTTRIFHTTTFMPRTTTTIVRPTTTVARPTTTVPRTTTTTAPTTTTTVVATTTTIKPTTTTPAPTYARATITAGGQRKCGGVELKMGESSTAYGMAVKLKPSGGNNSPALEFSKAPDQGGFLFKDVVLVTTEANDFYGYSTGLTGNLVGTAAGQYMNFDISLGESVKYVVFCDG